MIDYTLLAAFLFAMIMIGLTRYRRKHGRNYDDD
jgi:hypothetical protein